MAGADEEGWLTAITAADPLMANAMHLSVGLIIIAVLFVAALVLFFLDRLAVWMECKGWIYYRNLDPKVTMRGVLGGFDQFVHPEVRHVEEEKSQRKAESDQSSPSDR